MLCRYLRPLKPPVDIFEEGKPGGDQYAIEKCARFVSMIPFLNDMQLFNDLPDMYCNSQEFLDLGGGDCEEHAMLLANYFQYVDDKQNGKRYKSYLVYGYAMPEGFNVYVMRRFADQKEKRDFELWSPITGDCYFYKHKPTADGFCAIPFQTRHNLEVRMNDAICPMKHVYTVVGTDNVYQNQQEFDFPVLMDWNLDNKKCWKKLFSSDDNKAKFDIKGRKIVQPESLIYTPALSQEQISIRREKLQKYLVEQFQEARIKDVRKTTKWLIQTQENTRHILDSCELHNMLARHSGRHSSLTDDKSVRAMDFELDNITRVSLFNLINFLV